MSSKHLLSWTDVLIGMSAYKLCKNMTEEITKHVLVEIEKSALNNPCRTLTLISCVGEEKPVNKCEKYNEGIFFSSL